MFRLCDRYRCSLSSSSSSSSHNSLDYPKEAIKNPQQVPPPPPSRPPILHRHPPPLSPLSRLSLIALSATLVSIVAASYALLTTNTETESDKKLGQIYADIEHAIDRSNESFRRIVNRMKQTEVAAAVLWKSLRSVLSSANHEVRSGFEFRVAAFLADIAAANGSRRAPIVGAGGGAVVDCLLETVAVFGDNNGTQAEAARALAYLIADPNVAEAVLGRPRAVPYLLRKDESVVLNSTNVFTALGTLRKKKFEKEQGSLKNKQEEEPEKQPGSMETQGKSNVEFRNEVSEAIARHESSFDQIHDTLQTVLTELQSLRVQLASFHLEGIALQWLRWLTKFKGPLTWDELTKAVLLRFGPTEYKDPSEALTRLKQTSTVAAYQETFEKLSHRVDGLPKNYLIGCFIAGLRDNIRLDVKIKQPRTLADITGVARLIEERNSLQRRWSSSSHTPGAIVTPKPTPNNAAGILGPPPAQKLITTPNSFRKIISQGMRTS
ncbi:alpha/beta-Hydrolases superfamily protein [Actinidia rufa]|uniref:Alpha/beta-Hydrolases superfamily protein n=1 Tax=Actinidia rufa TaxID=165716 RepID=A0A7J0EK95_9ERIC|nr:alpha/beta-Hydrolases superfamily protein [Actinidia rufa]